MLEVSPLHNTLPLPTMLRLLPIRQKPHFQQHPRTDVWGFPENLKIGIF